MTNLSDLFPAGAGKQVSFTADGAIAAGKPVQLQSDGTVTEIDSSTDSATLPEGSTTAMVSSGSNVKNAAAYADPFNHNRWAFVWQEKSGDTCYVYVKFITRSGTSLTISPARTAISHGDASWSSAGANACWCTHTPNKLLIGCDGEIANSLRGQAFVVTVSGAAGSETISSGSPHQFTAHQFAGDSQNWNSPFVPIGATGNYLAGTWANSKMYGTILTVSGTTVTSDSNDTELTDGSIVSSTMVDMAVNPWNPTEGAAVYTGTSYQFRMNPFTISGTTLTRGDDTDAGFSITDNNLHQRPTIRYVADGKAVVTTKDKEVTSSRDHWYAFVATIASDSISVGTHVSWTPSHPAAARAEYQAMFDCSPNTPLKGAFAWISSGGYPYCRVGTFDTSNNTVSFGTDTQMDSSNASQSNQAILAISQSHGEGGYFLVSWHDDDDVWVRLGHTGGTYSNFEDRMTGLGGHIGIADAAISNGASGNVTLKGGVASNGLSSLTPGTDYYTQSDGSVGTTSTSFKLGKALSATSINLEYTS